MTDKRIIGAAHSTSVVGAPPRQQKSGFSPTLAVALLGSFVVTLDAFAITVALLSESFLN